MRWKCKCSTCTSPENCPAKCSRVGNQDIVQYYEFKATYCKTAALDAVKRKATTEQIKKVFSAHSIERMEDMIATEGETTAMLGSAAASGNVSTCENDDSRCTDFSMDPAGALHLTRDCSLVSH